MFVSDVSIQKGLSHPHFEPNWVKYLGMPYVYGLGYMKILAIQRAVSQSFSGLVRNFSLYGEWTLV